MKYYMLIAILFVCTLYSQQNNVWILDDANHLNNRNNWTSPLWGISCSDIGVDPINSPFTMTSNGNLFLLFDDSNPRRPDMYREDGWYLLKAYLGDSNLRFAQLPNLYVVLYNRERGIIRYFFRRTTPEMTYTKGFAMISAEHRSPGSSNTSGILSTISTPGNYIYALDRRVNSSGTNAMGKYIGNFVGEWLFMDTPVAFDDLAAYDYNNSLMFYSAGVNVGQITGNIDGTFMNHSMPVRQTGFNTVSFYGNYMNTHFRAGNDLRNSILALRDNHVNTNNG
jgi:hypothetical protein